MTAFIALTDHTNGATTMVNMDTVTAVTRDGDCTRLHIAPRHAPISVIELPDEIMAMLSQIGAQRLADRKAPKVASVSTDVLGEQLFSVEDVASMFKVRATTVREWIKGGELRAARFGKMYRISENAIRQYNDERMGRTS